MCMRIAAPSARPMFKGARAWCLNAHVDRMPTRLEGRDLTMVLRPLKKA